MERRTTELTEDIKRMTLNKKNSYGPTTYNMLKF